MVQDLQPHCVDFVAAQNTTYVPYCTNSTYYDMDFGFTKGPFTDDVEAKHYQYLLSNCFFECRSHGTRWSMIYISGAIITGAHIFQSILITLGIWISCLRFFALFFQFFCSLGLITLCIIMASFRYNSIGKLASLSLKSARMTDVDGVYAMNGTRTFADDGELIQKLFITMLVYLVGQLCLGMFSIAPPTAD